MRLEDPAAAALVVDHASRRYLEPLMQSERSATDLAAELGVHHSSVLYRLRQFMAHSIIELTKVEARRGRPIKYYRAAAEGYFIPFDVTPFVSQETIAAGAFRELQLVLERSIGAAWTAAASDRGPLGLHFYNGTNGPSFDLAPETRGDSPREFFAGLLADTAPAVWDSLTTLRVTKPQAKDLQRDLAVLLARYRRPRGEGSHGEYLVRLAMAPLLPSTAGTPPR